MLIISSLITKKKLFPVCPNGLDMVLHIEAFVYNFLSDLRKVSKYILGKFEPFSINPVDATGVNELAS